MLTTLAGIILCGCQSAPEENIVTSKKDGSFDIAVIESATEEPSAGESTYTEISYMDQFQSSDNSVNFTFEIQETVPNGPNPVVEVVPHYLSGADTERVARALFGDVDFYEYEPLFSPVYSKSDIQRKLARWTKNYGAAGISEGSVEEKFILEYTKMLETAPDENPHTPCQWTMKAGSYYLENSSNVKDTSEDNDEIKAETIIGDVPFVVWAITRNRDDYKQNLFFVEPDSGSNPYGNDYFIFRNQICKGEKPNDEDLKAVAEKAEHLLEKMELGEWKIDQCFVEELNPSAYIVHVNAVPKFLNLAAVRRPQFHSIHNEHAYSSTYYLTDASFEFSPDGDLFSFEMRSPVDVQTVINQNAVIMEWDKLMEIAKTYFTYTDKYAYGSQIEIDEIADNLRTDVCISNIEYGLVRVRVPDSYESYYYVPGVFFYGRAEFYGKYGKDPLSFSDQADKNLLILNAIDGSVIQRYN